jgi:hypothetical protein
MAMIGVGAEHSDGPFFCGASLQGKANDAQVMLTVTRCWIDRTTRVGIGALMLLTAFATCCAAPMAQVSGVVRDAQGVAQMGALVQVLAAGSVSVATAITDMHGRYSIAHLVAGSYQVRASSLLCAAGTRRSLRLSTGMLATVNLTLSMLADPVAWLPTQRRKADEPADDWTWTLRSTENRPILRMLGDGEIVPATSDGLRRASAHGRVTVLGGDRGFGTGGVHTVAALEQARDANSDMMIETDLGAATGSEQGASTDVAVAFERTSAFAGAYRMAASYESHPEMADGSGATGLQVLRMSSAKKMQLGDAVDIEAGGTVYAIHTTGTAFAGQPFLRITAHPGEVWAVRYSLASSPDLEGFDGLDSIRENLPVAAMADGRLQVESGRHQEFSVARKMGSGVITAAVFHDAVDHPAISGVGANGPEFANAPGEVILDRATGSFRFLGRGYTASGVSLGVSEPLTPALWVALEYQRGGALTADATSSAELAQVADGLRAETANALTASLKGRVLRTGTRIRAAYCWQPKHLVTAVDSYDGLSPEAYLGFYVRQAVRLGDRLPPGIEATIEVENLLAQGYQPFLSADGQTLFLAASPRTIQAGLSFTF